MRRYLVRHAKAGSRSEWKGDDRQRPLSNNGRRQAVGLADRLIPVGVKELLSSPYLRCVQTLEPLAERVGLTIQGDDRLAEGTDIEDTLELLRTSADGAVLCTHGDVFDEVIDALARGGTEITTPHESRKGSFWILEGEGGSITRAAAEPPSEDRPVSVR